MLTERQAPAPLHKTIVDHDFPSSASNLGTFTALFPKMKGSEAVPVL